MLSTVAEVRDAFNRAKLPDPNVYGRAIETAPGIEFVAGSGVVHGFPSIGSSGPKDRGELIV